MHILKNVGIWQVLALYAVASWIVLWLVSSMISIFGLPAFFMPFAVALLLVGAPIMLTTAIMERRGTVHLADGPGVPDPDPTPEPEVEARPALDHESWMGIKSLFTWRNALGGGVLAFLLWLMVAIGWILLFSQRS
jgi:hypothetical protein